MNEGPHTVTARDANEAEKSPREKKAAPERNRRLHAPERGFAVWGPPVVLCILAVLLLVGIWNHMRRSSEERQFEQQNAGVVVNVQTVHPNDKAIDLLLPGSVQAFQATTLYARSNGFLGKWLVDIGDRVTKGQTLAEIETPDLEQQLQQAVGNLNQAKSNFEIARVTAVRWQELYNQKVVSAQDNDQQQAGYQAAASAQSAAQANVNQLGQLVSFNQIIAPFDGLITFRYLDVGALVQQGSGAAGTAIYDLQQTDPLRVYVYVPQSDAPLVHVGVQAKLMVREYANREFIATVTRTAGAIDPASRTLLTELEIPNKDGALYAGMYGEINFSLHDTSAGSPILVPANAFMFRTAGAQAVVVRGGKIHWQTITVGRDYGTELQATSGLKNGDQVVINPSDSLVEGLEVKTQTLPPPGANGSPAGQGAGQKGGS